MRSYQRFNRTCWMADMWEHKSVLERVEALVGHSSLDEAETDFVAKMAKGFQSPSFLITNAQITWLDRILVNRGFKPLLGGNV